MVTVDCGDPFLPAPYRCASDEAIAAILLEHDVSYMYMPFDLAAQANAPIASAGTKPSAKARIRIQKLVETLGRARGL